MGAMKVEFDGENAVFTLANGDVMRVTFAEAGCGADGFGLKVMSDRGMILVRPSSGNACVIQTERALIAERQTVENIAADRRLRAVKK